MLAQYLHVFTKSFGELSFEKDGFFKALKGLAVSLYFVMLHLQDLEQEEVERRFKEHHLALVAEAKSLQAGWCLRPNKSFPTLAVYLGKKNCFFNLFHLFFYTESFKFHSSLTSPFQEECSELRVKALEEESSTQFGSRGLKEISSCRLGPFVTANGINHLLLQALVKSTSKSAKAHYLPR